MNRLNKQILLEEFSNLNEQETIMFNSRKIKCIESKTFEDLINLENIFLSSNELAEIAPDAFRNLPKLQNISLYENQLSSIDSNTFKDLNNLQEIDLHMNQLKSIKSDTFNGLNNLEKISLYSNQLSSIVSETFSDLKNLKTIDLMQNKIVDLNSTAFKGSIKLEKIDLSTNQIMLFPKETLFGLTKLQDINLENNQITSIEKDTFSGLNSLREINLSNNKITSIAEGLFKELTNLRIINLSHNKLTSVHFTAFEGSTELERMILKNNQLTSISFKFEDLTNLKQIDASNNKINEVDIDLFRKLPNYCQIDLRNNIDINDMQFSFNQLLQTQNNQEISKECFKMYTYFKNLHVNYDEFEKNECNDMFIVRNEKLRQHISAFMIKNKQLEIKEFDISLRKIEAMLEKKLSLLDIFIYFKDIFSSYWIISFKKFIEDISKQNKSIINCEFSMKSAESMKYLCERNDLLLFEEFFSNEIDFKPYKSNNYIENDQKFYFDIDFSKCFEIILKTENERLAIYFFKLVTFVYKEKINKLENLKNSSTSLCDEQQNKLLGFNKILIEKYFKKIFVKRWLNLVKVILNDSLDAYNSEQKYLRLLQSGENRRKIKNDANEATKTLTIKSKNDKKFSFSSDCHFITEDLEINPDLKCESSKFTFSNRQVDNNDEEKQNEFDSKTTKILYTNDLNVTDENNSLLTNHHHSNNKLNEITVVKTRSQSVSNKIFYRNSVSCIKYISQQEEISDEQNLKEKEYDYIKDNILVLIRNSQDPKLLRHEATQRILADEWKTFPGFVYYLNLILYLLFITFYSINIENYLSSSKLTFSRWVSLSLILYFILIEIFQLISSTIRNNILVYLASFKNWFEIFCFSLSVLTLCLENGNVKSSLFSISIILSYFTLVFRLNKCFIFGAYVNVFGIIIKKSIKFFIIVFVALFGFLLSFRNRSNIPKDFNNVNETINPNRSNFTNSTFSYNEDKVVSVINDFKRPFSYSIFKIFGMLLANLETDEMGIENGLNWENLVNFIIYGCFIVTIPLLFINIFTGISIDEVQKLIENSRADNASNKIEYIFKIRELFNNSNLICMANLFDSILENIYEFLKNLKKKIKEFYFMKKILENYRDSKLIENNEENEEKILNGIAKLLKNFKEQNLAIDYKFKYNDKKMNNMEDKLIEMDKKWIEMDIKINQIINLMHK
jgi:Leucine-rich repeat (LRR) protein